MDEIYVHYNEEAWDQEVEKHNIWTDGLTEAELANALEGNVAIRLTTYKILPQSWLGELNSKKVLAVGSGGGQQAILFALAGAHVTLLDISSKQLAQDQHLAEELNLSIEFIKGDMRDLSMFEGNSFDLIFNPASTVFIDDVRSFYTQCSHTLKPGGTFLTCVTNPTLFLFDEKKAAKGTLKVKYTLPYSDLKSLDQKTIKKMIANHDTFEFSHTLADLLGGLGDANLVIEGIFSDRSGFELLDSFISDAYLAVRAVKRLPRE